MSLHKCAIRARVIADELARFVELNREQCRGCKNLIVEIVRFWGGRHVGRIIKFLCVACMLSASATISASQASALTYQQVVRRLYDLSHLAEPPPKGEKGGSWTSSVGPVARYDATSGTYHNWGDGDDSQGFRRKEGENGVVAEMNGPGVIWRVWSAYPRQGHIKYFIDGAESPVLDMPFAEYFNNQKPPFNYPELTHVISRGHNSYIPIAFQRSIKIVLGKDWGSFYHFNYTLFPSGTSVPSFKGSFNDAEQAALTQANTMLGRRGERGRVEEAGELLTRDVQIPPGATVQVADLRGSRAITSIQVTPLDLKEAAGGSESRSEEIQILRELTMQVAWDNESVPSIWSPLGDFFGTAPGINKYRLLSMGMTADQFYSRWYMPFSKKAVVEIKNDGRATRRLRIALTHKSEPRADRLLRFHVKWHRDDFGSRDANRYLTGDRWPDWPVLIAEGGAGRFCGFHLHVWNPNPVGSKRKAIPEGWGNLSQEKIALLDMHVKYRAWWGEGDEKFFVDGEKFPSTFGTGSEDYFGYAFAAFHPEVFDSAFQSQPLNRNNFGHVSNVRAQVADNVPFHSSFEAVIEKYHPNAWPLLYATTAYWYQVAGVPDTYRPVPVEGRLNYFVDVERDTDIFEAEQLDIVRKDSGAVVFDAWSQVFSADHAIVWKDVAKAGDRLVLNVPVKEDGNFEILIQVGRSPDAGVYQMSLDGRVVGEVFDLGSAKELKKVAAVADQMFYQQSQYVVQLQEISLGAHYLSRGDHEIGVEAITPGNKSGFLFPMDYVRLKKNSPSTRPARPYSSAPRPRAAQSVQSVQSVEEISAEPENRFPSRGTAAKP
jgi:hypothetical protein